MCVHVSVLHVCICALYIHINVCEYVFKYMRVCMCAYVRICVYMYAYVVCMYVRICTHVCIFIKGVYVCVYMYGCMCVLICVDVYTYRRVYRCNFTYVCVYI